MESIILSILIISSHFRSFHVLLSHPFFLVHNIRFCSLSLSDGRARIIEDPVNQTAFVGFNVTFNCSAAGLLEQNITWVKNNNSHAVNSNPRVKVIRIPLDGEGILQSQLSIKEVKEEDKGKYYCVAKSSAREIESKSAFLFIKHLGEVAY